MDYFVWDCYALHVYRNSKPSNNLSEATWMYAKLYRSSAIFEFFWANFRHLLNREGAECRLYHICLEYPPPPQQHAIMLYTPLHRNSNILHLHCGSSVQILTTQAWHWRTSPLTTQGSPTTETEELQLYEAGTATSIHASTTLKIINKMKNN